MPGADPRRQVRDICGREVKLKMCQIGARVPHSDGTTGELSGLRYRWRWGGHPPLGRTMGTHAEVPPSHRWYEETLALVSIHSLNDHSTVQHHQGRNQGAERVRPLGVIGTPRACPRWSRFRRKQPKPLRKSRNLCVSPQKARQGSRVPPGHLGPPEKQGPCDYQGPSDYQDPSDFKDPSENIRGPSIRALLTVRGPLNIRAPLSIRGPL